MIMATYYFTSKETGKKVPPIQVDKEVAEWAGQAVDEKEYCPAYNCLLQYAMYSLYATGGFTIKPKAWAWIEKTAKESCANDEQLKNTLELCDTFLRKRYTFSAHG